VFTSRLLASKAELLARVEQVLPFLVGLLLRNVLPKKRGPRVFRARGNGLGLHRGRFGLDIMKNFFTESDEALERAAQGGGGVLIAGGVQKPCRHGPWGPGLAGRVLVG